MLSSIKTDEHPHVPSLFWVPMIFEAAQRAECQIEEMLSDISTFQTQSDIVTSPRASTTPTSKGQLSDMVHRRRQITGEHDIEIPLSTVDVVPKSENTKYYIISVLKRHFLFSQLHDYELEDMIDSMKKLNVGKGNAIITEGGYGDAFYILEKGECDIVKSGVVRDKIEGPDSFGDLALMYNSPRTATVISTTSSVLWVLNRNFFRQAMITTSSNQYIQLSQFLSKISLFKNLNEHRLNQLARSLTRQSYDDGQYIISQGEIGEQLYVIYKGSVKITETDDNGEDTQKSILHPGTTTQTPHSHTATCIYNIAVKYKNKHAYKQTIKQQCINRNTQNAYILSFIRRSIW